MSAPKRPGTVYAFSKVADGDSGAIRPARRSSNKPSSSDKPKMLPCSVRFTAEEKACLEKVAGNQSLAAYIRFKALDGNVSERASRHLRKQYKPKMDYEVIAKLLGMLGQSELGPSMIALAAAADIGALDMDEETHARLRTACDDIAFIRSSLIVALGIKPQGNGDT